MTQKEKRVPYAQIPKPIIDLPISAEAKMLYALLNDRFQLSLKNDFKDEDGCVFCYFSNREICEKLRCAHGKTTRLLRELEVAGLIYREKLPGKADRIYVGGVQDDQDEACRFPAGYPADSERAGMPKSGTGVCRLSAHSKNDLSNQEYLPINTEENKARLSSLLERLDMGSFFSADTESALRQITEHIETVMLTSFPLLRVSGTDLPTEEVRTAFDRLTTEDVKTILNDFKADPLAFGSMLARLFEAGQRHGTDGGIAPASNELCPHNSACQGIDPLSPLETEDAV